jgi:magnesium chelatase family protein
VRPVRGVLPAVAAALGAGVDHFIVPEDNAAEARALRKGLVFPIARLEEASLLLGLIREGGPSPSDRARPKPRMLQPIPAHRGFEGDLSELKGQPRLRRALEIAAAGGHNVFLFGPPGSGKTMAARRFIGLLPALSEEDAVQVASLYSWRESSGREPAAAQAPIPGPHHSASLEGMIGGGRRLRPGEISLAHKGVLFLDEAAEFHADVLQSLREPIEEGSVFP